jgi:hypothetical protein
MIRVVLEKQGKRSMIVQISNSQKKQALTTTKPLAKSFIKQTTKYNGQFIKLQTEHAYSTFEQKVHKYMAT